MTSRQLRQSGKTKETGPGKRAPEPLEDGNPVAVCVGSLYAYDMVLTMEACGKSPEELLSWYRQAMEAKYPLESDRKSAFASTESQLRTIASGKDPSQSEAARKLLGEWEKRG